MSKKLVIVESPMKARTIKKFLPKDFIVEASMGHVRDLPQSSADIPEKFRKEAWSKLGVNVEKDFEPLYIIPKGKSKTITELRKLLKDSQELYLATDEDREGESISWHLFELLKPKVSVKRLVFHEITKSAIQEALQNPREIDFKLVSSQETRRILDRLVGYTLSPLIWKKIAYGLSAGRVQSAGLRLLVERERERMNFTKSVYWDLKAVLEKNSKSFEAKLVAIDQKPVAIGKDFDPASGALLDPSKVVHLNKQEAQKLLERIKNGPWVVQNIEEKEFSSKPFAPFITSTLQQEANRKLGLSARQTMRLAQLLYEKGLITYMRTDSPHLSNQAISGARKAIESLFGSEFLSPSPKQYTSKDKAAQEAHEAIRPTGDSFAHPKDTDLEGQELALYDLIWKRTVASQMSDAKKKSMNVKIQSQNAMFNASGMKIIFPGYLRAYVEGKDDPDAALDDQETILPDLSINDKVKCQNLQCQEHETKPVARYTEASLIQRLEKEGIGRPSTYASIINTILERNYARKAGNALIPTFTGFAVIQLLEKHFIDLVDYAFTSQMENILDDIADGKQESLPYLKSFYLGNKGLQKQVATKDDQVDAEASRLIELHQDDRIEVRIGRFGAYLLRKKDKEHEEEVRASIPEDIAPCDLTKEKIDEIILASKNGPQSLGQHPKTNENIYVLLGRFGPYVQQGEITEDGPKPKRASVPKNLDYRTLTMDQALNLLKIPYEIGLHPQTQKPIMAHVGRFGPYILHDGESRSIKKEDDIYNLSLDRAVEILSQEKRSNRKSSLIKDLGTHPKSNQPLAIYTGKYGPYIKHGKKNIRLPKEDNPENVTVDRVLEIILKQEA